LKYRPCSSAGFVALGHPPRRLPVERKTNAAPATDWSSPLISAAETLDAEAARDQVSRGVAAARRAADKEMRAAIERSRQSRHRVAACAVLVPEPMPAWSVDEILAVHFPHAQSQGRALSGRSGPSRAGVRIEESR
jgi:hypothetical protein